MIDRLMGPPGERSTAALEGMSVRDLKRSVARDLEWLLNTRIWTPWNLESLEETRQSILNYGVPEFSRFSWTNADDARAIAGMVEEAIRTFEPRLLRRTVKTSLLPSTGISDFSLRIRIDAVLQVDPISEPVTFDTGLDFEGGGLRVESFE